MLHKRKEIELISMLSLSNRMGHSFGFIAIALFDGQWSIEEMLDCIYPDFCIYSPSSNSSLVGFLFVGNGFETHDLDLVEAFSRIIRKLEENRDGRTFI